MGEGGLAREALGPTILDLESAGLVVGLSNYESVKLTLGFELVRLLLLPQQCIMHAYCKFKSPPRIFSQVWCSKWLHSLSCQQPTPLIIFLFCCLCPEYNIFLQTSVFTLHAVNVTCISTIVTNHCLNHKENHRLIYLTNDRLSHFGLIQA